MYKEKLLAFIDVRKPFHVKFKNEQEYYSFLDSCREVDIVWRSGHLANGDMGKSYYPCIITVSYVYSNFSNLPRLAYDKRGDFDRRRLRLEDDYKFDEYEASELINKINYIDMYKIVELKNDN